MFVSIRRIKAVLDFAQQDISYIFQRLVWVNATYSSHCQTMSKLNERAVTHIIPRMPYQLYYFSMMST